MGLPAKLAITNSNYCEYGNSIENLVTLRVSSETPWEGGTLSMDVGGRHNTTRDPYTGEIETSLGGYLEAKCKQKFSEHTRGYVRYSNYDKKQKVRVAAGGFYPINENVSVYGDAHWTYQECLDAVKNPKHTVGFWLGANVDIKDIPGLSIWIEPIQLNIKTQKVLPENERRLAFCGNIGITWTLGKSK